ncbi:MAG: hypothetical protein NC311_06490 [Muribaculaceae bacterium]|nr:hypothetical protein [Muribaculaceae bacterium]
MKCPVCGRNFNKKADAVDHLERLHSDKLESSGMDACQYLYFSTHGTLTGKCMCGCGKDTPWNAKTGKPCKVYPSPECRKRIRETYKANMARTYNGRTTLLDDMDHQREMQKHRRIAGDYKFSDGGVVDYLGKLEMNWLMFCDKVLEFTSNMVVDPPEYFQYMDEKTQTMRTYMPDYYLPDYNLLVEIKDGGDHPNGNKAFQDTTRYKVAYKDEVMRKQDKYNYIRISGTNYGPFVEALYQIIHEQKGDEKERRAVVIITEEACTDISEQIDFDQPEQIKADRIHLLIGYIEGTNTPSYVAISDSTIMASWIVGDYENQTIFQAAFDHPIFQHGGYEMYKYIGNEEVMQEVFSMLVSITESENTTINEWDILGIFDDSCIYFDNGNGLSNNTQRRSDFILVDRYFH